MCSKKCLLAFLLLANALTGCSQALSPSAVSQQAQVGLASQGPAAQPQVPLGQVTMARVTSESNNWSVFKPDGTLMDTSGSTTQGLQEAINYASEYGYPLFVEGGGYSDLDGKTDYSAIRTSTTINIPACTACSYTFHGVDLYFLGSQQGTAFSGDGLVFDSADMMEFNFTGQIVYTGNASAVRILPTNPNSEGFTGITSSHINISNIAVVNPVTLAPDNTHGVGLKISPGNGTIFVNSSLTIGEVNSGMIGIQVDDITSSASFQQNIINSPAIHGQSTYGVLIGSSPASAGKIFGNKWTLNLTAVQASWVSVVGGLNSWSNNDSYYLSIVGSGNSYGVGFNSTTSGNTVFVSENSAATPFIDSCGQPSCSGSTNMYY